MDILDLMRPSHDFIGLCKGPTVEHNDDSCFYPQPCSFHRNSSFAAHLAIGKAALTSLRCQNAIETET